MRRIVCFVVLSLLSSVIVADENEDSLEVDAVLCKSVAEREPIEEDSLFLSDLGKIYCWTLVTGAAGPTTITHVWFYGEKELVSVELEVKSPWFRTWSYKTIPAEWTGDWHVKVYDSEENLLRKLDFKIVSEKAE